MSADALSAAEVAAVRSLLDRQAIVDCIHRYTRGLDRHDDDLVLSAYHEDGLDDHGIFVGSPQEFVDWANELHESQWRAHQHFMTNLTVEIDGDTAHAESYFLVCFRRIANDAIDLAGARYLDRLERRDGEWRVAHRLVLIEWNAEATVNPDLFPEGFEFPGRWDRSDASYARPYPSPAGR